jgi:hypothetical protein
MPEALSPWLSHPARSANVPIANNMMPFLMSFSSFPSDDEPEYHFCVSLEQCWVIFAETSTAPSSWSSDSAFLTQNFFYLEMEAKERGFSHSPSLCARICFHRPPRF